MPLQATSGAASYDGFGGGAAAVPTYIEDVFSTYLYTGNSSTQTITNGIDLSGKGGMLWTAGRTTINYNTIYDTVRTQGGYPAELRTYTTAAEAASGSIASFNSNGYSLNSDIDNVSGRTYASWTFRKQPKFFDVVTYTGTGSARTVAHNLGSVPGSIIVKRTDTAGFDWIVYHRSTGNTNRLLLNDTVPAASGTSFWNDTTPTSTVFTVGTNVNGNASGGTYVAYLFAHDAGGFGLTGTDNVISCGSFTGNTTVTLGYEPQWILLKNSGGVEDWYIHDTMRGWPVSGDARVLFPNLSSAESGTAQIFPNATGFTTSIGGGTYIYIAIRRGPMKVPTLGTSVFSPITSSASTGTVLTTSFPVDLQIVANRTATDNKYFMDRLRGVSTPGAAISTPILYSNLTDAEVTNGTATRSFDNTSFQMPGLFNGYSTIFYNFRRAPGFFDEVCYTGTGASITLNHNLGVIPEIIITKKRIDNTGSGSAGWIVMSSAYSGGFISGGSTSFGQLQSSAAVNIGAGSFLQSTPTSTTIPLLGTNYAATDAFVAYLFATCPGVSKVGSYTGTATTLQINCGFTGGARFVLIKRTDSTGDWYVWDSARGIVAGNDPYLLLNSTAAEVTSTDYVDTYSAGFEISSTAPAAINASGGTFIFLAIA